MNFQGPTARRKTKAATSIYNKVDFTQPAGEPALSGPDSVSWRIFKNPVSLFIGGITAVLLEFAEPRVRTGVWEHSIFPTDPLTRMQRTGLAAMVTVYGARSVAEKMIAGVTRMHARVAGTTPDGTPYRALDPVLMNWVQATATFGFIEAYHRFVHKLSQEERDRAYKEAKPAALLFGAPDSPASEAGFHEMQEVLGPGMEPHPIVQEFLDIVRRRSTLPLFVRPMQPMMVRAAIDILPAGMRELLELDGRRYDLKKWERGVIRFGGRLADRIPLRSAPPALACVRLGLPANYLYRKTA